MLLLYHHLGGLALIRSGFFSLTKCITLRPWVTQVFKELHHQVHPPASRWIKELRAPYVLIIHLYTQLCTYRPSRAPALEGPSKGPLESAKRASVGAPGGSG